MCNGKDKHFENLYNWLNVLLIKEKNVPYLPVLTSFEIYFDDWNIDHTNLTCFSWIHIHLCFQFLQTSEKIETCYLQQSSASKISLTTEKLDLDIHNNYFEDPETNGKVNSQLKHSNHKDNHWYNNKICWLM